IELDREEDDVDRADCGRIVGGDDVREMYVAFWAHHAEAGRLQRFQVRAARDERDVGSGGRETRAEIAADASRPDNRDAHSPDCSDVRLKADTTTGRTRRRKCDLIAMSG